MLALHDSSGCLNGTCSITYALTLYHLAKYIGYPNQSMLLFKVKHCNNILFKSSIGCSDNMECKWLCLTKY